MTINAATIVTCFFDINRAEKGDGRTVDEYKKWIKTTLQVNCNLYIITESKFYQFFIDNRPKEYKTFIKVMEINDLHYYKYYDKMKCIIESEKYKSKIANPTRVECVLPEYNIIQYSKFHCLEIAIEENPFKTEYFFWMDVGCSRFFLDVDISKPYPSNNNLIFNTDKFIIQNRRDLMNYDIGDNFIWEHVNLLCGTMFGGNIQIVLQISRLVEDVFIKKMLENENVNNEQLGLVMVWKEYPHLFHLVNNFTNHHLILFKHLSI
jgi:hypothetical protein